MKNKPTITLAQGVEAFLAQRKPLVKEATLEAEAFALNCLLRAVGVRSLRRAHDMQVVQDLASRLQRYFNSCGLAPATMVHRRSNFSRFFAWCVQRGYLYYNPCRFLRLPKVPRHTPPTFTFQEYEQIKAATLGTPYHWFTICSFRTGMSMIDVCLLQWTEVDMENLCISVQRHKLRHTGAGATRVPFLPGSDIHLLLSELQAHPSDHWPGPGYVCPELARYYLGSRPQIGMAYTSILRRLGITGRSAMHWRHTFVSGLANSNTSTAVACKMSGHSDPSTFARYVKPDVEAMRACVARATRFLEGENVKLLK